MLDTLKFNKRETRIIAHRGLSGIECENTAAAFVAAGNRSYLGIETDVHATADGRFVLLHDASTERVAGGIAANVEALPFDAVSGIRLIDREDGLARRDLVLPTLDEYIRICRRYGKLAVLELKGELSREQLARIRDEIEALAWLKQTVFISFSRSNLTELRALLPDAKIQFLTGHWEEEMLDFIVRNRFDLDIGHGAVTPALVEALHRNGLKINCWTVNVPARGEELAAMGVDYITTNILE